MKSVQKISETTQDRILEMDLSAELKHGVVVSNLAYDVAKELGLGEKECYQLAIAGMLHDIGKLKLEGYINGQEQNPMVIEELKYVRMHSTLGYEILKDQGYSDYVLESILYDPLLTSAIFSFENVSHDNGGVDTIEQHKCLFPDLNLCQRYPAFRQIACMHRKLHGVHNVLPFYHKPVFVYRLKHIFVSLISKSWNVKIQRKITAALFISMHLPDK